MNKIKDIHEQYNIIFKELDTYYKDNKCFFNEEIKYKKERKDNLFPFINNLFKDCKHLVGYDQRYFNDDSEDKNIIKLNNNIFQHFLLKIKNKYPKVNHLSHMRNKSYLLCSIEKKIIIIKTNLFKVQNEKKLEIKEIKTINSLHYNDLTDIAFSIELNNRILLGISENYIYIYESYVNESNNADEDDFYKNYFLQKKIKIKNKVDDILQVSQKIFCIYSFITMEIIFYDIKYMECITKIGGVEGTPGNLKYFTLIKKNLLLFAGAEKTFIINVIDMEIKAEIRTNGLVSCFCFLPNNGLLCGEIIIDYSPNNPWKKGDNKHNLVQYQITDKEIKKISEKSGVHKDIIRSLYYFENNIILSCSTKNELKLWY